MTSWLINKRSPAPKPSLRLDFGSVERASVHSQCPTGSRNQFFTDSSKVLGFYRVAQYDGRVTTGEAIVSKLNGRGRSHHWLVEEVKDKVPAERVYAFLSGEWDLTGERALILLQALGLQITQPQPSQGLRR